ncbi:unnamed protein product [Cladocopium goreaui]|uniref:Vacuolar-sorting protein SNF8 n=1 Tax=Cladocopium goreaui TaxID=2562237 RepID=A0A9P1GI57_9DINO|nr:unnamed protein product [Cladocopium goreaui]
MSVLLLVALPLAAAEVTTEVLSAREWQTWGGPGGDMASASPASVHPVVKPGDTIFLRAYNGKYLGVKDFKVGAKSSRKESAEVSCLNAQRGPRQELVIERNGPMAHPVAVGDMIFLRAHTGNHLDVVGETVRARFPRKGLGYHAFIVEKQPR